VRTNGPADRAYAWKDAVIELLRAAMPGAQERRSPWWIDGEEVEIDLAAFELSCSVGRRPNIRRALHWARRSAPSDRLPLAMIRDEEDGSEFAVMPMKAFLLLVSAWWAATQPAAPQPSANCSATAERAEVIEP